MNNLSINRVLDAAPAVAKRKDADREGLIDTSEFLRHVRRQGYLPVLAVQGSGHDDSTHAKEKNGRHFIVTARPTTQALFLLNSHTKDRRAHIGIGWWKDEGFLIGPSTPVQRWLGFEDTLEELATKMPDYTRCYRALTNWAPGHDARLAVGRAVSRHAYMPGVENRPQPLALVEGCDGNARELGFEIMRRMRKGNIEPAQRGGRRIKGVRRPDGLFHAGMVLFHEIVTDAVAHGALANAGIGTLDERLVRP